MPKDPQPYEKSSTLSKKEIIFNNFLGGISWALGATVGITLIFTLLGLISPYISLIPVIGTFFSDLLSFILATNPNLNK